MAPMAARRPAQPHGTFYLYLLASLEKGLTPPAIRPARAGNNYRSHTDQPRSTVVPHLPRPSPLGQASSLKLQAPGKPQATSHPERGRSNLGTLNYPEA